MRYRKITSKLICGAVPEAQQDDDLLKSLGVSCVINCVEEPANQLSRWTGSQCYLPQLDDGTARDSALLARGIEFFKNSIGIVYVHCWEGKRRGPTMAYAILRAEGMLKEEAFSLAVPALDYLGSVEDFLAKK